MVKQRFAHPKMGLRTDQASSDPFCNLPPTDSQKNERHSKQRVLISSEPAVLLLLHHAFHKIGDCFIMYLADIGPASILKQQAPVASVHHLYLVYVD